MNMCDVGYFLKKIPYVTHIHLDVDPSGPLGFLLTPYKKIFLRLVLNRARKVICLSDEQKQQMVDKYRLNPDRIVVIPNAVTEKFFIHKEFPTPDARLLFVGRL